MQGATFNWGEKVEDVTGSEQLAMYLFCRNSGTSDGSKLAKSQHFRAVVRQATITVEFLNRKIAEIREQKLFCFALVN